MLVVDQLRGQDSTGVAFITKDNDVFVSKEIGSPNFLMDTKSYEKNMKRSNKILIGHNRYATQGAVNRKNAHPFEFDGLVGVHNGTLRNKHKLDDPADFIVDSENLYHHINKNGLRSVLDIVDGAYSLVWYDKWENELNLLRNHERPLFMARSTDKTTLLWASEEWMIKEICARENFLISEVIPLVTNMHYRFTFNNWGVIEDMIVKEEKASFVPIVVQHVPWKGHAVNDYNRIQQQQNQRPKLNVVKKDTAGGKVQPSQSVSVELVERYAGAKKVRMELIAVNRDRNGAKYLNLMDPNEPSAPLRLYIRNNDPLQHKLGEEITGDIGAFSTMKGEGGFFKVIPRSVVFIFEDSEENTEDEAPFDQMFKDHNGHLLTAEEWEKKYPRCSFCSDVMSATDAGNRITSGGDCLCPSCATNPMVTECISGLMKVF